MRARLLFTRNGREEAVEIAGPTLTIGRGAECDFQIPDERVSTRHCRLWAQHGEWLVQDLRSTNRTYVNGELVGDEHRRIADGDILRLGARETTLFEARFVARRPAEPAAAAVAAAAAPRPAPDDAPLRRRIAELEAAQLERNAELVRLGALCKTLKSQIGDRGAATDTRQIQDRMTREIEELKEDLATIRTDHASCADDLKRARQRSTELEARLEAQERKARAQLDDGNRRQSELESKLRLAESELQTIKVALATAQSNVRALQQAHDDALARLAGRGDGPSTRSP
jgi:hypothetical protein